MSDEKLKRLRLKVALSIVEGTPYKEWQNLIDVIERVYETKQPDEVATRERVDDFKNIIDKLQ